MLNPQSPHYLLLDYAGNSQYQISLHGPDLKDGVKVLETSEDLQHLLHRIIEVAVQCVAEVRVEVVPTVQAIFRANNVYRGPQRV